MGLHRVVLAVGRSLPVYPEPDIFRTARHYQRRTTPRKPRRCQRGFSFLSLRVGLSLRETQHLRADYKRWGSLPPSLCELRRTSRSTHSTRFRSCANSGRSRIQSACLQGALQRKSSLRRTHASAKVPTTFWEDTKLASLVTRATMNAVKSGPDMRIGSNPPARPYSAQSLLNNSVLPA